MLPPEEGRPQNGRDSEYFDLEQIEQRLDTSRTLDIFTMKPKVSRRDGKQLPQGNGTLKSLLLGLHENLQKCQLQMNPPALPFKRGLRKSSDVVIYFTPLSTGQEIIVRRAHIFLLTDLFLICERMSPSERAERPNGPDMWLLYPPLAGKHLRVADLGGQGQ